MSALPLPRPRRTVAGRRALAGCSVAALLALPGLAPVYAVQAPSAPQISEIAYAGPDDTDFIEIQAAAGTDLSGWTVGSVTRGGTVQAAANTTTLSAGTSVSESGALAVRVPVSNSVSAGSAADGSYGASAFLVDPSGGVVDFELIGGVVGGKGVTGAKSASTPAGIVGKSSTPTGATAGSGKSIARLSSGTWEAGAPTPNAVPGDESDPPSSPTTPPEPANPADVTPVADIQGTGDTTPLDGKTVTTRGVVTAAYPTGGLSGFYIQTPGSGGDAHAASDASDGVFVYAKNAADIPQPGKYVEVRGTAGEHYGQTQISASGAAREITEAAPEPKPVAGAFPEDPKAREALEGMLVQPTGDITVTDNYATNQYGEIGLANGSSTLKQPTDVAAPGSQAAKDVDAQNAKKSYLLDDGGTADYLKTAKDTALPYLSTDQPVRVGAKARFTSPTVVGYDHNAWRLQPLRYLGGNESDGQPVSFANTREEAPKKVGGALSIASFNVLNYFPTTGDQLSGCKYYTDRAGKPVTVKDGCDARGAANAANLKRQQDKIVAAIDKIDTSVLSLEEIEDSSKFGKQRDWALGTLVDALNEKAGEQKWKFVPSPKSIPRTGSDVIRTAFIYQPAKVQPVGDSTILDDPAFANARAPLAQEFATAGSSAARGAAAHAADDDAQTFLAIVNHFKSKGSGSGPGNDDTGDGQGKSNADRIKQAKAVAGFAAEMQKKAGTSNAFLLGDLNSYTEEDPMQELYKAGFADIGKEKTDEDTYLFGGMTGSLDHVMATQELLAKVTGADVWNINSVESVALEYSRYNYNAKNLYAADPFRSSDHDPLIAGFDLADQAPDDDPKTPGEDPNNPGEDPNTPGEDPGTPGEDPNNQGEDPGTPGEDPNNPGENPGAPGEHPNNPGQDPADPGTNDNGDNRPGSDEPASDEPAGNDPSANDPGDHPGALPRTGAGITALFAGLGLVLAGAAAVVIARRRRN